MDHRGIGLEARAGDPERLALASEAWPLRRFDAEVLPQPVSSFEGVARPRHPLGRKLRCEHSGSNRGRRRAALPHRQLADARDAQRDAGRDGDGDRVAHGRAVQPEDRAGAAGRADRGEHALVPALQRDLIRHPAEDLVRRRDRGDHRPPVRSMSVGHREHRGDHVARMPGATSGVGVVTVQVADEHRVREGR